MIALEGADATYQGCLDVAFNPTRLINNPACQRIQRNPTTGGGGDHRPIVHERGTVGLLGRRRRSSTGRKQLEQRRRAQPQHVG